MSIIYCEQRSEEWFQLHVGRVTASSVRDVLNFKKTGDKGPGAKRIAYMGNKVAEILTGMLRTSSPPNISMQWGIDHEDEARRAYSIAKEIMVDRVGFAIHPTIERSGASPDGLVCEDGCLEIKCPDTDTHIEYILGGVIPEDYEPQMQWEMACAERAWCDFVSFDPRLGRRHELFIKRLERNEQRIAEITDKVLEFIFEADAIIARLNEINPPIVEPERVVEPVDPELYIQDSDIPAWAREMGAV